MGRHLLLRLKQKIKGELPYWHPYQFAINDTVRIFDGSIEIAFANTAHRAYLGKPMSLDSLIERLRKRARRLANTLEGLYMRMPNNKFVSTTLAGDRLEFTLKYSKRIYGSATMTSQGMRCVFDCGVVTPQEFIRHAKNLAATEIWNTRYLHINDIKMLFGAGELSQMSADGTVLLVREGRGIEILVLGEPLCKFFKKYDKKYRVYWSCTWLSERCDYYTACANIRRYIKRHSEYPNMRILPLPISQAIKEQWLIWPHEWTA